MPGGWPVLRRRRCSSRRRPSRPGAWGSGRQPMAQCATCRPAGGAPSDACRLDPNVTLIHSAITRQRGSCSQQASGGHLPGNCCRTNPGRCRWFKWCSLPRTSIQRPASWPSQSPACEQAALATADRPAALPLRSDTYTHHHGPSRHPGAGRPAVCSGAHIFNGCAPVLSPDGLVAANSKRSSWKDAIR